MISPPSTRRTNRPDRSSRRTSNRTPDRASTQPASAREPFHSTHLAPDSLGFALDQAAQAVGAVRAGATLPAALADGFAALPPTVAAASRGAVQDIAYRTMRRLGLADQVLRLRVSKMPPPFVANVLACALALLADEADVAAYAPFTIVDQAVRAVGARREAAFAKGLVNAVLRGFLRERDALLAAARASEVARWNYPQWWIDAVRAAWPEAWPSILDAGNAPGPLTLRVNANNPNADANARNAHPAHDQAAAPATPLAAYLARLRAAHIDAVPVGEQAVRLAVPLPVERIPGFADGDVSVQDAGAQLAAPWLRARAGMRVLDACAAPGGKTCHLLELAALDLVALESDAARARRIDENLARLGLRAQVVIGDAAAPSAWYDGQPFERILADVPCSASGIVRRHPDIRWLRRASDLDALVAQQRRILAALWPLLKPGGELLYVTCSIFPAEGEEQARWFENSHPDAVRLDAPGQLLPTRLAVTGKITGKMRAASTAEAARGAPAPSAREHAGKYADDANGSASEVARPRGAPQAHPVPGGTTQWAQQMPQAQRTTNQMNRMEQAEQMDQVDHDGFFYARFRKR